MFELAHNLGLLSALVPALPLAAAIVTAVFGPRLLKSHSHWPTLVALGGSTVLSVLLLVQVDRRAEELSHDPPQGRITLWHWGTVAKAITRPNAADAAAARGGHKLPLPLDFNPDATAEGRSQILPPRLRFDVDVTLRADPLTAAMLTMVSFVSLLVAVYSVGYMHGERGYWRFFSFIGLFVFSMAMLVSVSNFLLLYVFWEAVGLCSYLLIGFWYQKPAAAAAGMKAFLVNRVGDFGFALGVFLIWISYGTLNFHDTTLANGAILPGVLGQLRLSALDPLMISPSVLRPDAILHVGDGVSLAICLLLLLGACGKSAQFPLHVWLPDAMEGPTPVSALIHAATMVTAGVYMIVRCTPLFLASAEAQQVVAVIGGFTALMAGLIALAQTDLKRILAYSTISQLGYMFLAVGTGSKFGIVAGMFHLMMHAFFKALLFLGAGSVMHALCGVIDLRRFGGLWRRMPVTGLTFLVGCVALAGVPPFSGFWSKDAILTAVYERGAGAKFSPQTGLLLYQWLYWAGTVTAFLTAFYTFRAFFLAFCGAEKLPPEAENHAHESGPWMKWPLVILAVLAAGAGLAIETTDWFADFIGLTPSLSFAALEPPVDAIFHWRVMLVSSVLSLAAIGLAAFFYLGSRTRIERLVRFIWPLYRASYEKFWFDEIDALLIVRPLRLLSRIIGVVDDFGIDALVNLVGRLPGSLGRSLRFFQNGLLPTYALAMAVGVLALIGWLVL